MNAMQSTKNPSPNPLRNFKTSIHLLLAMKCNNKAILNTLCIIPLALVDEGFETRGGESGDGKLSVSLVPLKVEVGATQIILLYIIFGLAHACVGDY